MAMYQPTYRLLNNPEDAEDRVQEVRTK